MRILVVGAGVIGSVYAAKLLQAGHEVVLFARSRRLTDLQAHGLILVEAQSGQRTELLTPSIGEVAADERFDLVLVAVRSEQLSSALRSFSRCAATRMFCSSVIPPDTRLT